MILKDNLVIVKNSLDIHTVDFNRHLLTNII